MKEKSSKSPQKLLLMNCVCFTKRNPIGFDFMTSKIIIHLMHHWHLTCFDLKVVCNMGVCAHFKIWKT